MRYVAARGLASDILGDGAKQIMHKIRESKPHVVAHPYTQVPGCTCTVVGCHSTPAEGDFLPHAGP